MLPSEVDPDDPFPSILPEDYVPMPDGYLEPRVAVELPERTWNLILRAVMRYGLWLRRREETSERPDFVGLRRAAEAAAAIGDAINAPDNRRFRFEELTRND